MDFTSLIVEEFIVEWRKLALNKPIMGHLEKFETFFDLNSVEIDINSKIDTGNRELNERYHTRNLRNYTRHFAELLYQFTNGGESITHSAIENAKNEMKRESKCTYPC